MSDFSLAELKLAFGYHIARMIVDSDLVVTLNEAGFLERHFPRQLLARARFVGGDGGFTERHQAALRQAARVLPSALSEDDKLAFLTLFVEAMVADDAFEREEGDILEQAAELLGVSAEELDRHLDAMPAVGQVTLPPPEEA